MNIKFFSIFGTLIALTIVQTITNAMMNFQVLATIIFGTLGLIILVRSGNKALRGIGQDSSGDDAEEEELVVPDTAVFSDNPNIVIA